MTTGPHLHEQTGRAEAKAHGDPDGQQERRQQRNSRRCDHHVEDTRPQRCELCAADAPVVPGSHRCRLSRARPSCMAASAAPTGSCSSARALASALKRRGIRPGDTVAAMLPNIPAMLEAHHGVPMCGAILNALNTRLDARDAGVHPGARRGQGAAHRHRARAGDARGGRWPAGQLLVIDVDDPEGRAASGSAASSTRRCWPRAIRLSPLFPADEWQAIALNYTSGTTGNPKGVVYHHRGAHLNAVGNVLVWSMPQFPVYLWTLPMFHCNGWCFPWSIVLQAGTQVCLRRVASDTIFAALAEQGVTHLCGAPIVMGMLVNAPEAVRRPFAQKVRMMTAASAPPAAVLERMEALGDRGHPCLRPDRGLRAGHGLRLAGGLGRASTPSTARACWRARACPIRCSRAWRSWTRRR